MDITWTNNVPTKPGWYWVMWRGYEYPEVVILTEQNDLYACGDFRIMDWTQVAWCSTEPLTKPDTPM